MWRWHQRLMGLGCMNSEPLQQIEMRISIVTDVVYAVLCGLGCPGFLWAASTGFADLKPEDLSGIRSEVLAQTLLGLIGPLGFQLIAGVSAILTGAVGAGAIWRLRDRRPAWVPTHQVSSFIRAFIDILCHGMMSSGSAFQRDALQSLA